MAFDKALQFQAAVAVAATRRAPTGTEGTRAPPRDLLVLDRQGSLSLFVGARRICTITVPLPQAARKRPYAGLLRPDTSSRGVSGTVDPFFLIFTYLLKKRRMSRKLQGKIPDRSQYPLKRKISNSPKGQSKSTSTLV